jgi:hypothetical protein
MNPPPDISAPDWTRQFTLGRFVLLLAALVLAAYPEVVLGTHSFFYRDFGLFTYPVAYYSHESFWHGQVPLWDPLNNCGIPFLAQWNTTVCYPLSLVYLLLPLRWSLDYFCLGHLVLAGVAMYLLALRWTGNRFAASVAGLAFALNGVTFNCLMWTSNLAALAWMPLVILCVEQAWREGGRKIVCAALAGAMQMLAGAPEIILLTWALLGTLWLGQIFSRTVPLKISFARFAGGFVLVLALSAVQLLPFLELLRQSHRDVSTSGLWSMPAWGWANFLVPLFRCEKTLLGVFFQKGQQWTSSYYPGVAVLALAVIATIKNPSARTRWLAGAAIAGAVLALGDNGVVYSLLRKVIPAVSLARYPIKFVVLTTFALPLLAALAADFIARIPVEKIPSLKKNLFVTGAVLALAIVAVPVVSYLFPHPPEQWRDVAGNAGARILFLTAILALVFQLAKTRRAWLGVGVLLLLGLDILTHMPRQNPTVINEAYGPLNLGMSSPPRPGEFRAMVSPLAAAYLASAGTPDAAGHLIGLRRALYDDCNLPEHVAKIDGFFSLHLRESDDVLNRIYTPTNFPAGLVDFLGAAQISDDRDMFLWQARTNSLPLATAGQQPVFAGESETLRAISAPAFDPRRVVYLPPAARDNTAATNPTVATILGTRFSAQRITLDIEAAQPAWVVLAQSFHPCWRATVDGRPTRLWQANHAFQAVEILAGRHEVKLVYRDTAFECGAGLSAAALAGCGVYWLRRRAGGRLFHTGSS